MTEEKKDLHTEYVKGSQNSHYKGKNPCRKWTNGMKRHFTKDNI